MDPQPERKKDFGRRVEVYWPDDVCYYRATVVNFSNMSGKHQLHYDDGYVERIVIKGSKHRWLEDSASPKPEPIREGPPPDPLEFPDLGLLASPEKRSRSAVKLPPKRNTPTHFKYLDGNADEPASPPQNGTKSAGRPPSPLQSLQTDRSEAAGFDHSGLDGDAPPAWGADEVNHPPRRALQHGRVGTESGGVAKQRPVGSVTSPRERMRSSQGGAHSPVGPIRSPSKSGKTQRMPLARQGDVATDEHQSTRGMRERQVGLQAHKSRQPHQMGTHSAGSPRVGTPSAVRRDNLRRLIRLAWQGPPGNPLSRLLQQKWLVDLTQTDPPVTVWVAASIKHNINLLLQIHLPVVLQEGLVGVPPELLGPYLGHLSRPPYPHPADLQPAGSDSSMGQQGRFDATGGSGASSTHAAQALQSAAAAQVRGATHSGNGTMAFDDEMSSQEVGDLPRFTPQPCLAAALRAIFQKPQHQHQHQQPHPTRSHRPTHLGASAGTAPALQPAANPSSGHSSYQLQHPSIPPHFGLRTRVGTQDSEPAQDSDGLEQMLSGDTSEEPEPQAHEWVDPGRLPSGRQQSWPTAPAAAAAAAPTHPPTHLQQQSGHAAFLGPNAERLMKQSQQLAWAGVPGTRRLAPRASGQLPHPGNSQHKGGPATNGAEGMHNLQADDLEQGHSPSPLWDHMGRNISESHPVFQQSGPFEPDLDVKASLPGRSMLGQPAFPGRPISGQATFRQPTAAGRPMTDQPAAATMARPGPASSAAAGPPHHSPPTSAPSNTTTAAAHKQLLQQLLTHVRRSHSQQHPGSQLRQGKLNRTQLLQAMRAIAAQKVQQAGASSQPDPNGNLWAALAERLGTPAQEFPARGLPQEPAAIQHMPLRHHNSASDVLHGYPIPTRPDVEAQPAWMDAPTFSERQAFLRGSMGVPQSQQQASTGQAGGRFQNTPDMLQDEDAQLGCSSREMHLYGQGNQLSRDKHMPADHTACSLASGAQAGAADHPEGCLPARQRAGEPELDHQAISSTRGAIHFDSKGACGPDPRILQDSNCQPLGFASGKASFPRAQAIPEGSSQARGAGSDNPAQPFVHPCMEQDGPHSTSTSTSFLAGHHAPSSGVGAAAIPPCNPAGWGEAHAAPEMEHPMGALCQGVGTTATGPPSNATPLQSAAMEGAQRQASGGSTGDSMGNGITDAITDANAGPAVNGGQVLPLTRPLQPIQCSSPPPGWHLWKRMQQAGSPPAPFSKPAAAAATQQGPPHMPHTAKPAATAAVGAQQPIPHTAKDAAALGAQQHAADAERLDPTVGAEQTGLTADARPTFAVNGWAHP